MRFAGEKLDKTDFRRSYDALQDKPIAPSFNAEDLVDSPEMAPGPYFSGQDLMRDKYIQQDPRSGVSRLPGGEQGPVRGPHTPIKNYGGKYMPDGSAGSGGFIPGPVRQASIDGQEVAALPAGLAAAGLIVGGLSQLKRGEMMLDGGGLHHGEVIPTQKPKESTFGLPTGLGSILLN